MRKSLLSFFCLFLVAGCGAPSHEIPGGAPSAQGKPGSEDLTSFAGIQSNILDKKCTSCHSGSDPSGHIDLTSYDKIMGTKGLVESGKPATSTIYTEVKTGDMPDSGPALPDYEVQAISDWISAGAPNGSFASGGGALAPVPDPNAVSYTNVQSKLFAQYCVKCHSGPTPKGKVDLAGYDTLMKSPVADLVVPGDAAKSLVYEIIIKGKMPPKGATVDAAATKLLADWINAGALNN